MKVVLDTNILRTDPKLRSQRFRVLFDIVARLGATFAVPRIVFEEFESVCRRELVAAQDQVSSSIAKANRFLISLEIGSVDLDVDIEVEKLKENLRSMLRVRHPIDYKPEYLQEAVRRCVNRLAPCSRSGEEFRDLLVWLTALDVAESEADKTVVLISQDGAFYSGDDLREELAAECESRGVLIRCFKDLSFFAKDHEDHVGFITTQWMEENISETSIELLVEDEIERIAASRLLRFLDEEPALNQQVEPTGYVSVHPFSVELDDFFVNKLSDGSIRIDAAYSGVFEVECEVSVRTHYREGRFARPGTPSWRGNNKSGMYTFEIDVYISVEVIVIDEQVSEIKITDVG